jgi:hypothetical protein
MGDDSFTAYVAKCAAAQALQAVILPGNKVTLFQTLSEAGVRTVVVSFDGSGDSGQIESIVARNADGGEVPLPLGDLPIRSVDFEMCAITERATTAGDLIERMAYEFLEHTHGGWEDNEGAYGDFTFDVAEGSITLEYSERYIETHYHEHTF